MGRKQNRVQAVGYVRTSSAANVGADRDSEPRQRRAIENFAKSAGYEVVDRSMILL
jgi:DNA invertase Pin-like site-specific DNA recombinase